MLAPTPPMNTLARRLLRSNRLNVASVHRGFSLIELMIGMAIGLLGLTAVSAMMTTFSQRRVGITQTTAAQDNGVMALYQLEREIAQSGYGLAPLQGCANVVNGPTNFFPVSIIDGGTAGSDTIVVQYVSKANGLPGTEMSRTRLPIPTATSYNVRSAAFFAIGDYTVATQLIPNCTVTRLTSKTDCVETVPGTASLGYTCTPTNGIEPATAITGAAVAQAQGSNREPPSMLGFTEAVSTSANPGFLVNLGAKGEFVGRQYFVTPALNALEVAEYSLVNDAFANANRMVDDIVFLKAQYGLNDGTAGNTVVTTWTDASAFSIDATNVGRVVAIRVGVVARSAQRESQAIDQPAKIPVLPAISTIGAAVEYTRPDDHFRYRNYSTVIPLRNVLWAS